jgi:hypothetical protein
MEIPPLTVIWGGLILLVGVAIAVIGNRKTPNPSITLD